MDWITKEQAKEASKGTELEAAEFSLKHWQQGRDASFEELRDAVEKKKFNITACLCAVCIRTPQKKEEPPVKDCKKCCLPKCCLGGSVYTKAEDIFEGIFPFTREKAAKFQDAADKMCDVIQEAIDKLETKNSKSTKCAKPELEHGDLRLFDKCFGVVDKSEPAMHMVWQGGDKRSAWLSEEQVLGRSVSAGTLRGIFADLKRNIEPLAEFRLYQECKETFYANLNAKLLSLQINNKEWCHCTLNEAIEIHQKLGQLIATAKRKMIIKSK